MTESLRSRERLALVSLEQCDDVCQCDVGDACLAISRENRCLREGAMMAAADLAFREGTSMAGALLCDSSKAVDGKLALVHWCSRERSVTIEGERCLRSRNMTLTALLAWSCCEWDSALAAAAAAPASLARAPAAFYLKDSSV